MTFQTYGNKTTTVEITLNRLCLKKTSHVQFSLRPTSMSAGCQFTITRLRSNDLTRRHKVETKPITTCG